MIRWSGDIEKIDIYYLALADKLNFNMPNTDTALMGLFHLMFNQFLIFMRQ